MKDSKKAKLIDQYGNIAYIPSDSEILKKPDGTFKKEMGVERERDRYYTIEVPMKYSPKIVDKNCK